MVWWPYFTSLSKRSLSRCKLMDHILCKWRLFSHYFEWVWVILGGLDIIFGRWGWVGVYGVLFWVGEGGWGIILDRRGWVGRYLVGWGRVGISGGEWGWVGVGALFDNAFCKILNSLFVRPSIMWLLEFPQTKFLV